MKILILDNFFDTAKIHKMILTKNLYNFILYYKIIKLKGVIRNLRNEYNENVSVKVITNCFRTFFLDKDIAVELLSDFRINLDREKYLKMRNKLIEQTRLNLFNLLKNLNKLRTVHINKIFIPKLLEFDIVDFFKATFEAFELLKVILETEKYDRIILFNCNPNYMVFFKFLNDKIKHLEIYKDFILKKNFKMSKVLLTMFFFNLLIKESLIKKSKIRKPLANKGKKNILFVFNSRNQFNAMKPIYEFFKKDRNFNSIYYRDENFFPLKKINNLIKILFQFKKIWSKSQHEIFNNIKYDSLNLKDIVNDYYSFELYYRTIRFFNNFYHINQFLKNYPPTLAIFADEMRAESRLYAKYCKLNNIPTIYIPHGGIPIWPETITKSDFSYIAVPGESDKNYLISKGESEKNIIVTGRPHYRDFYEGKIKVLAEVFDMFDGRKYKLEPSKFTILLATSPVDYKSREKELLTVTNSLKELNLIDNLIIKLHPREDGVFQRKILHDLNLEPVIVRDYNIFELIKSSKLFLSRTSTTILESMIIGTPIILLDLVNLGSSYSGKYLFCEEKSLISVKDQKGLTKSLQDLINQEENYIIYSERLKELAKKYSYYNQRFSSTEMIVSLIHKIIKN